MYPVVIIFIVIRIHNICTQQHQEDATNRYLQDICPWVVDSNCCCTTSVKVEPDMKLALHHCDAAGFCSYFRSFPVRNPSCWISASCSWRWPCSTLNKYGCITLSYSIMELSSGFKCAY